MSSSGSTSSYYQAIYEMVCSIPEGRVATYGQIARLVNRPNGARQVGYALAALPEDNEVPWHRVVNVKGEISHRNSNGHEDYQRILLEEEGVEFSVQGRIYMQQFAWDA